MRALALAFVAVPLCIGAQGRDEAPRSPGILISSTDTLFSAQADRIVASTIAELRRLVRPEQLRVLGWLDVVRISDMELPRRLLTRPDLFELGKQVGIAILELHFERRPDSTLGLQPSLLTQHPQMVAQWEMIAADPPQVARDLARRIAADTSLRRVRAPVPCSGVFFEFQVDRQAQFIDDSTLAVRPGFRGTGYESLVQFVVDTLGHPESGTLKALKLSNASVLQLIREALPQWRFVPAQRGACRVRQLVMVPVNR